MARLNIEINSAQARQELDKLNASLEKTGQEAIKTEKATDQLEKELDGTGKRAATTRQILEGMATSLRNLEQGSKSAGQGVASAAREIEKAEKGSVSASSALGTVAAKMAAVFAAIGGISGTVQAFSSFERTLAQVGSVASATGKEFEDLRAAALAAGATTEFSASQAGEGLLLLARAGFDAKGSIEALPGVLNLAIADALSLGEAADIASSVVRQFGLAGEDLARVGDILVQTSNQSNTGVRQLGDAFSYVGPIAKALGLSLEETNAALGILGDAGIQASRAGTGLNQILRGLTSISGPAAETLRKLGLSQEDVSLESNSLVDVLKRLRDAQIEAFDAQQLFGDYGQASALALTAAADRLEGLTQANFKSAGAAEKAAIAVGDNLTGSWRNLLSAVEAAQIALVSDVEPALRGVVDTGTEAVTVLFSLGEKSEETSFAVGALATSVAVLVGGLGAGGLAKAATAALGPLSNLIPFLAANPFIAAAAGVGALTGGVIALSEALKEVPREVREVRDVLESLKFVTADIQAVGSLFSSNLARGDGDAASDQFLRLVDLLERVRRKAKDLETVRLPDFRDLTGNLPGIDAIFAGAEQGIEQRLQDVIQSAEGGGLNALRAFQDELLALGNQVDILPNATFSKRLREAQAILTEAANIAPGGAFGVGGVFGPTQQDLDNLKDRARNAINAVSQEIAGGITLAALDGATASQAIDQIIANLKARLDETGNGPGKDGGTPPKPGSQAAGLDKTGKASEDVRRAIIAANQTRELEAQLLGQSAEAQAFYRAQVEATALVLPLGTQAALAYGLAAGASARANLEAAESERTRAEAIAALAETRNREREAALGALADLDQNIATAKEEAQLLRLSNRERAIQIELIRARQGLIAGGVNVNTDASQDKLRELEESLRLIEESAAQNRGAQILADSFGQAFADIIQNAENAGDILRNLFGSLSNQLLSKLGAAAIGNAFQGTALAGIFGSANGNAFTGGSLLTVPSYGSAKQFALGGLLNGPTFFGLANNKLGVGGEAGLELLAPATRDSRGRVAVSIADTIGDLMERVAPSVTVNYYAGGPGGPSRTSGLTGLGLSTQQQLRQAGRALGA